MTIDETLMERREHDRQYYQKHRKERDGSRRRWRQKNRDKVNLRAREWKHQNKEVMQQRAREYTERLHREVFIIYGNGEIKCACCGEEGIEFLTIDHINNDGAKQRQQKRRTGKHLYCWLRKNNYPSGFQVLCFNCNNAKSIYGECPHGLV